MAVISHPNKLNNENSSLILSSVSFENMFCTVNDFLCHPIGRLNDSRLPVRLSIFFLSRSIFSVGDVGNCFVSPIYFSAALTIVDLICGSEYNLLTTLMELMLKQIATSNPTIKANGVFAV